MNGEPEGGHIFRVTLALAELAKGLKAVTFYPSGHPSLVQLMSRIVSLFEGIPLPDAGLEIGVTKNALLFEIRPIPNPNKTLVDLNRDLYLRRVSKLIFLPGMKEEEMFAFLSVLGRDPETIQDAGGLEKLLPRENVARIWVNRVDYENMTELLKKQQGDEELPEEARARSILNSLFNVDSVAPEPETLDGLLDRLSKESSPSAYRTHIVALSRMISEDRTGRKIEYTTRAFSLFLRHIDLPPGGSAEIAELAGRGIKEMATDEMVSHYLFALRDKSRGDRQEVERILALFQERSVRPLIDALAVEEDLLVRKGIVEIITRIGRQAVPVILENLADAQWYTVRNMLTILGNLGMPDLAPQVAATLSHPDARVKKEAIKALSRLDHPFSVSALGELCFHAEESVALTAVAALSAKKEPEAVLALYRRAVRKSMFYPNYRFAQEAIDSLRAIGTDEAITALDEIIRMKVLWHSRRFREMKLHALRAIAKVGSNRAKEVLRSYLTDEDEMLRTESKRSLRRFEP
ncbi:MAG TPA: HEAT repeat domain-containing protein [Candidatus Deferrimicrobiaceae bacterium]|jgi:HEAT repeat protein